MVNTGRLAYAGAWVLMAGELKLVVTTGSDAATARTAALRHHGGAKPV